MVVFSRGISDRLFAGSDGNLKLHAGLYSQVKRAPKAKIKRKTFEMPGPAAKDGMSMDERCELPPR
jgi:hypothetical protein